MIGRNIHFRFVSSLYVLYNIIRKARRVGSDGSISASGTAGHVKIFNLGVRRGGDVHFLIARLYNTSLD